MNMRVAVALALVAALGACRPGEGPVAPRPGTQPTLPPGALPRTEPVVRVGITVDSSAAVVSATGGFSIRAGARAVARGRAGDSWTFSVNDQGRLSARAGTTSIEVPPGEAVRVIPDAGALLTIGARQYRGEGAIVARGPNQLSAINVVDMEQYLLGVVPREMGRLPANMIEALKTQAVAARTYAIGNLGGRSERGFDFYATVMDQVYGGIADEDSIVSRAVRETRGEILTYNGTPIIAYYSSTCGGSTSAIEESWPWRAALPYLKSVSDRIPGSDQYYCSTSNRFNWTTRWTREQLLAVLGETLRQHTGGAVTSVRRVDEVSVVERNASQRVTVRLVADDRAYTLRADSTRWVLRPQVGAAILNSSRIYDLQASSDASGVQQLEVRGGGWGHAIGMCQVGAMGRARAGHGYRDILLAYYSGVELVRLY